jgi:hypothetical protein
MHVLPVTNIFGRLHIKKELETLQEEVKSDDANDEYTLKLHPFDNLYRMKGW